ncbi:prolyl oligopeptidase family serine peptidase [Fulvivirgaceae bacterium BMA10]|uniref:Prolyl oligopeptidase family serine peptidase n=1 Tax=Splendidivirga corallicola TaxID=3051826 RepID=A0ABT8KNK8_9BACT|nr:prolyl oligopeptidase family serine peptidase [Fulvivirgaceae bacterium BMA10]
MKRDVLKCTLIIFFAVFSTTCMAQQTAQKFNGKVDYFLFLPEGYDQDSEKKWPLMLFLHGAGERGDDLNLVKFHGPPKIVENQKDFPFILVSPQCKAGTRWYANALSDLLDEVIKKNNVDTDRIYVTGLSMGGYGTWNLATTYPDRFAAIAPICGGGNPKLAKKIKDLPIWVFHGAKDRIVPMSASEEMVKALKEHDSDVQFTIYPEAGHDSWTETYNNPKLYEWFLQHKRTDH